MHPKIKFNSQYIKDLSFENPNSPAVFFKASKSGPDISISVDINSAKLQSETEQKNSFYEVMLQVRIEAKVEDIVAFICEIKYCGIISIEDAGNLLDEDLKALLLIKAPEKLFPFVREIIARTTSSGGFPPLMLDMIDFEEMYKKQSQN